MPFVLDASVSVDWGFEGEHTPYSDRVLVRLQDDIALTPAIWPLEVANAIRAAERHQRLTRDDVLHFTEILLALPITVEEMTGERAMGIVLELARAHRLSAYDASYLELAMREGLPLATRDGQLIAAARRVGVPLVQ